jgi:hypothetical protein
MAWAKSRFREQVTLVDSLLHYLDHSTLYVYWQGASIILPPELSCLLFRRRKTRTTPTFMSLSSFDWTSM